MVGVLLPANRGKLICFLLLGRVDPPALEPCSISVSHSYEVRSSCTCKGPFIASFSCGALFVRTAYISRRQTEGHHLPHSHNLTPRSSRANCVYTYGFRRSSRRSSFCLVLTIIQTPCACLTRLAFFVCYTRDWKSTTIDSTYTPLPLRSPFPSPPSW